MPTLRRKTIADDRLEYTLLGNDVCMWCDLPKEKIAPISMPLADGRTLNPGAKCTRIGGRKTSAGFTIFQMLPGEHLTFLGLYKNLDGTLALFDTREPRDLRVAFWIIEEGEATELFHFTPSCAGRRVQTTAFEFMNPADH